MTYTTDVNPYISSQESTIKKNKDVARITYETDLLSGCRWFERIR
jgi:hypothetical protein